MSDATRPTGADERVEAAARVLANVHDPSAWNLIGEALREEYRGDARAALAAADAVAAQDPAPRAEPDAWGVADPEGTVVYASALRSIASGKADDAGATLVPLGRFDRRPAPAPVVPDEADQATTDVRSATAAVRRAVVASEDSEAGDYAFKLLASGWRLVPPVERRAVEEAIGGSVHVASEAAAAVDAVLALRSPGWVDEVRDAVGEDDEGTHDGPAVTEPPC